MTEDSTKRRLLDAAGQVFAEKGFETATIREICDRAEANVAAVNYYFGDKQRLYIDAVREAKCARTEDTPMPVWPPNMPAADRLREFIRVMLTQMLEDRAAWHHELMLRELARPTAACKEVVDDFIRPMAEELERILTELLPVETPHDERWLIGFSIVGQCLFYYVQRPIVRLLVGEEQHQRMTIEVLADHIANFTLAALGFGPVLGREAATTAKGAAGQTRTGLRD